MLVTIEKVLELKQMTQFKSVSNLALSDLMAVSEESVLKKGEVIIQAEEANHYLYFLLDGVLEEENEKGEKKIIQAQSVVGLDTVFFMAQAGKTVRVKQNAVVLKVEHDKIYRMMALHPSLFSALLHELSLLTQK